MTLYTVKPYTHQVCPTPPARRSSTRRCSGADSGRPTMMEERQAREASMARTLQRRDTRSRACHERAAFSAFISLIAVMMISASST